MAILNRILGIARGAASRRGAVGRPGGPGRPPAGAGHPGARPGPRVPRSGGGLLGSLLGQARRRL